MNEDLSIVSELPPIDNLTKLHELINVTGSRIRVLETVMQQAMEQLPDARTNFLQTHAEDLASGAVASRINDLSKYCLFLAQVGPTRLPSPTDEDGRMQRTAEIIEGLHKPGELAVIHADDATMPSGIPRDKWTIGRLTGRVQAHMGGEKPAWPMSFNYRIAPVILSTTLEAANSSDNNRLDLTIDDIFASMVHLPEGYKRSTVVAVGEMAVRRECRKFFPIDLRRQDEFCYDHRELRFMEALVVSGLKLGDIGYSAAYSTTEWSRVRARLEGAAAGNTPYTCEVLRLAAVSASNRDALHTVNELFEGRDLHTLNPDMGNHRRLLIHNLEQPQSKAIAG